ncbi:MAG: peptide deformylase [Candidatus Omnitrophica bacterium]|nr:peptide deformylase [Candidatus Omnitrophota bacterium]
MAILPIHYLPDAALKTPTRPVTSITPDIRHLARDMIHTMHAAGGVGLAANQVGQPWQLFVASPDQERGRELVLLNPKIVSRRGRLRLEEGCLSLPGIAAIVTRAARVEVHAMTLDGTACVLEGQDLLARIFQHEIDHLHGLLFVDRLPWLARQRLLRVYHRQRRELSKVAR